MLIGALGIALNCLAAAANNQRSRKTDKGKDNKLQPFYILVPDKLTANGAKYELCPVQGQKVILPLSGVTVFLDNRRAENITYITEADTGLFIGSVGKDWSCEHSTLTELDERLLQEIILVKKRLNISIVKYGPAPLTEVPK